MSSAPAKRVSNHASNTPSWQHSHGIIPNFCLLPNVFLLVLLSEILAVLMTTLTYKVGHSIWLPLAQNSVFVVWISLCSAAIFCITRHRLNRMTTLQVTLVGVFTVGLITFGSTLLAISLFFQLPVDLSHPAQYAMLVKNEVVALLLTLVLMRYLFLRQQVLKGIAAESNARFEALQARIQPHFLFNTLNTIASLVDISPQKAEKTVEHLATLLRSSLNPAAEMIPLKQEIELCQHYLAIEQERLGPKLSATWQIDDQVIDWEIPPFTLQPLIENGVYHGIQRLSKGGEITTTITVRDGNLVMTVSNPTPEQPTSPGNQIAQANIAQRLKIRYGDHANMTVTHHNQCYQVELIIPGESDEHSVNR